MSSAIKSMGEVFPLIRNGVNIKQGDKDGGYPITRIETISNRVVDRNKMGYAGITNIDKYKDYILQDGDILMSHINSETHLGKTALYHKSANEQIIHGMNLLCLRPNPQIVKSGYAFYYLSSPAFLRQIQRITKKSVNQASFTITALKELSFPAVSLEQQDCITQSLSQIDKLCSIHKQQLQKLDELVKARFVEMFGDVLSCFTYPTIALSDVATVGSSKRIFAAEYVDKGIPFYRSKEIRELGSGLKPSVELYISPDRYAEIKKQGSIPKKGDILIAAIGATIGYTWIVNTDEPFYYKDGNLLILSISEKVNPVYLNHVIAILIDDYKTKGAAGSAQLALTIEKVEKMKIPYPPLSMQNEFATFVSQVDKTKLSIQSSLDQLETLKQSLIQIYFG